ncbi:MAG: tetratricopeptide repeat protein [Desulfuromonadaceae bacterium]|nr:tetratricopeptide repeat protein [Desulfuromonadaceae bacterium]
MVANTSHRKDSLALTFILLALFFFMNIYEEKIPKLRVCWFAGSILLWVTAFFAKGNALVFPLLALGYEYAMITEEKRVIIRWKKLVPVFCCFSAVGVLLWYWYIATLPSFKMVVIGAFFKTDNLTSFSNFSYTLMVLKSFAFMFSKLVIPLNLSMEYIYSVPKSFFDLWVVAGLLLVTSFFVLLFVTRKSSPVLLFLLIFVGVLWFPTSNIVWHFSYFAADRYMYAPSAGLCVIAAILSERMLLVSRRSLFLLLLSVFSLYAILSWKQSRVWHDDFSLYSNMLVVSPRSLEAMIGLSNAYFKVKDYENAEKYAKLAIERDFTDYRGYMILGNISFIKGEMNQALQLFLESERKSKRDPELYNSLGSVYDELGKTQNAIDSFKTALRLRPEYYQAYTNLAVVYERADNLIEAESVLKKALRINESYVPALFNMGVVLFKNNDLQGARKSFEAVLTHDPTHSDSLHNMSVICEQTADLPCYTDAVRRINLLR